VNAKAKDCPECKLSSRHPSSPESFSTGISSGGDVLDDLGHLLLDSLLAGLLGDLLLSEPGLALGVLLNEAWGWLDDSSGNLSVLLSWALWVSSDSLVDSGVHILEGLALESLLPLGELLLEPLWVLLLKEVIVLLNVDTENVLSVLLGGEDLLGLLLLILLDLATLVSDNLSLLKTESWESSGLVRNVEATIAGTLHGSEDTVTGGGADKTNIEVSLEWASLSLGANSHGVVLSVDVVVALEGVVELLGLEESAGAQQTGGISGGVVGETAGDTVTGELLGVSSADGHITLHGGVNHGSDDSLVSASHDESVLLGVVLVLVVNDEALTGVVVSLSLSSTAPLGLISLGSCSMLSQAIFLFSFSLSMSSGVGSALSLDFISTWFNMDALS